MWLNAQIFGGTIAAAIGVASCKIPKHLLKKRKFPITKVTCQNMQFVV